MGMGFARKGTTRTEIDMTLHRLAWPLAFLLLGTAAQAGDTAPTAPTAATPADHQAAEKAWERTHRASRIIGTDVRNRQGQKIGDIKDVVLDPDGLVAYAVVSTGGFLGVGDRLHAIPWTALQKDGEQNHFVLDMDKQRLSKAPGFDSKHWPNMAEERWNSETRGYYGLGTTHPPAR
jgi:sporulation protein YlmC with PRC-barrel domain